ncbi:hypothetical protein X759_13025 [Mesorhizobium sp. LSHC420B00]|nr:hypothetical protein X759_13025 [Mesorhizobium sp. LSHC420B00]
MGPLSSGSSADAASVAARITLRTQGKHALKSALMVTTSLIGSAINLGDTAVMKKQRHERAFRFALRSTNATASRRAPVTCEAMHKLLAGVPCAPPDAGPGLQSSLDNHRLTLRKPMSMHIGTVTQFIGAACLVFAAYKASVEDSSLNPRIRPQSFRDLT